MGLVDQQVAEHCHNLGTDGCFVYAIRCGDMVKIGRARNPLKRLSALRAGSADPLVLTDLFEVPAALASKVERHAQLDLCNRRVGGEWFLADAARARRAIRDAVRALVPDPLPEPSQGYRNVAIRIIRGAASPMRLDLEVYPHIRLAMA